MSANTTGGNITLVAERDGSRAVYKLDSEQSVLIGTSPHCGFRLDGEGLSTFHCLFSLEQGTLWVQDWASQGGTLVNGTTISAKTAVTADDQLRVGPYRITAAFEAGKGKQAVPLPTSSKNAAEHAEAEELADDEEPVVRFDASQPASKLGRDLVDPDDALNPFAADDRSFPSHASWFEGESFEQETIELLRAEVEELQGIVAQRDAQIAELTAASAGIAGAATTSDAGDHNDALLTRMDQLLEEAACNDERVAVMEEMLHAAEQAHQAEQEERQQLESWVNDIERRIAQRDELRNAEMEALRARLDECQSERDRAQRQLQQAAAQGGASKCYEETLERLQQQNHQLQEQLARAEAERRTLAERLDSGETGDHQSLREERAAIAQERALVSRVRSELTSKLAALEEMPERAEQPDREVAIRLRTLREHLREIHLQEQQQQQQADTLSSRIARLWKRVEP